MVVETVAVFILIWTVGFFLGKRLSDRHAEPSEPEPPNTTDCPKCGEPTHAFEEICVHCGYNRWE